MAQATLADERNSNKFYLGKILENIIMDKSKDTSYPKREFREDKLSVDIIYSNGYNLQLTLDLDTIKELESIFKNFIEDNINKLRKQRERHREELKLTLDKNDIRYHNDIIKEVEEKLKIYINEIV